MDEILSLRTLARTDEEKREACVTEVTVAAMIDRVDEFPREVLERLEVSLVAAGAGGCRVQVTGMRSAWCVV